MKIDPLQQYAKLHRQLVEEKNQLETRLAELNGALGTESTPSQLTAAIQETPSRATARKGRRPMGSNTMSLREAVLEALSNGPLARKELVQAVEDVGYVFSTNKPLISIGAILYGKTTPVRSRGGKYYLPGSAATETNNNGDAGNEQPARRRKRRMSAATKAKLSKAATARWAKVKAGK